MEAKKYKYNLQDTAFGAYPVMLYEGFSYYGDDVMDAIELPTSLPIQGQWGKGGAIDDANSNKEVPLPKLIDVTWLSLTEHRFYGVYEDLPQQELEALWEQKDKDEKPVFDSIIVGMAPRGRLAIWMRGPLRSEQIFWIDGFRTKVPMKEYLPDNPEKLTLTDYCNYYVEGDEDVAQNLKENGLPSATELDAMMQQYNYRYQFELKRYNEKENRWENYEEGTELPTFDEIGDYRSDASFDKVGDGRLLQQHKAAKPVCIHLKWTKGSADYDCYIGMEPDLLSPYFDLACGENPDDAFDFNIKVDWEQFKFQLSLSGKHQQAFELPEELLQIIVFQAGSECFKSKGFNLTEKAWMW